MLSAVHAKSITRAVRRATAEDLRPLHDLMADSWRDRKRPSQASLEAKLERGTFLVAGNDDEMHAAIYVNTSVEPARLDYLMVAADHRGRGLGQRLLGVAEAYCKAQGNRAAELEIDGDANHFLRFCRRAGYASHGDVDDTETLVLRKCLDS